MREKTTMKRVYSSTLACAMVLTTLAGCQSTSTVASTPTGTQATTPTQTSQSYTFADTIAWDAEYDVVVAGFGAGGAVASKYAAEAGANVLIVEKMPYGEEGGNSKVCAQAFSSGSSDSESTYTYYKSLYAGKKIDDTTLRAFTDGVAHLTTQLTEDYGIESFFFAKDAVHPVIRAFGTEYPDLPGGDAVTGGFILTDGEHGRLYDLFVDHVFDESDKIDVWYESPAVGLIQDPITKTIVGMEVERDGTVLNVRGLNGVILATGGFENNPEMIQDYLGLINYATLGAQSNTGDGIKMLQEVGADLWHMEAYEGGFYNASLSFDSGLEKTAQAFPSGGIGTSLISGSFITVGQGGQRYFDETVLSKHGHYYTNDSWKNLKYPDRTYVVFDQTMYDQLTTVPTLFEEYADDIYTADTIENLATAAGIDVENLKITVNNFNSYTQTGYDIEFQRDAATMTSFDNGPYYAAYVVPSVLNTQGGARKNENSQVLAVDGDVIPNLYVVGELGGITANLYQGATNMSECLVFGKIAGQHAATEKDPLPAYVPLEKVESTPAKIGEISDNDKGSETPDVTLEDNQYLGTGKGFNGNIYLKVTFDGDAITSIESVSHNETKGVSDPAFDQLPTSIIDAQSTEVDTATGATFSSKGIIEAVNDAIAQKNG